MLAGHLHRELSLGEPQCFPAVVLAKIDGLGDVRVCLCPILANLKYHPGAKLELALAQQIAYAEQRLARSSNDVWLQVSKAASAALIAGSTCSFPAFW